MLLELMRKSPGAIPHPIKKAGAGSLIVTGPAEDQHDELNSLKGVDQFISDFALIDRNLFSL